MNNLLIMPLLIPLVTAVLLVFFYKQIRLQKWISGFSVLANVSVAGYMVHVVRQDGIQTLNMGGWAAPYGIVFVADMFASLLVLTTTVVSAACLYYAFGSIGKEREKFYFYPFFQFLNVGVIGSFLTGDIFNLFVCFEVMLISSYALIVLGGTKKQLRESLKYILINIISSALFVASVAYLYAVVGTLNMAHLSVRVAEAGQGGVLTTISVLFLIVFGLKAGLFLYFWLPGSYKVPPAAVTAVFGGLLTKVGLYAIIRTFTLIFYHDPYITHTLIGWLAAATMLLGVIGAIAYWDIHRILIYNIVAAVGFIAFGLAAANQAALEGAIYYLVHDMVVKALLFLLGGVIIAYTGTAKIREMGGLMRSRPVLGWMFFIAAMALVGVPPLSGFIGKLLIVEGGLAAGYYWITGIGLLTSLLILYSMMRIFMNVFWGVPKSPLSEPKKGTGWLVLPASCLVILTIVLGLGAEWIYPYVNQAGETLLNPDQYIQAVLKE
ncbi:Na+/H+ antiporter subunit D [Paenibacillus tarimensis]|uniref:Na+/H+ antiporter subunit D n=1 Tax=Paenibacillus tarimensis TaxID=416012 RepID=UPI001F2D0C7E|nr:Na+/H+ antiporter subunit D [Paenibacillus tarimensis]MCF2944662.1 Na+/H+ antiporter subunit D [Paenibacillus tarimensis]